MQHSADYALAKAGVSGKRADPSANHICEAPSIVEQAGRPAGASPLNLTAEPASPPTDPTALTNKLAAATGHRRHNSARWDCHLPASKPGPSFLNTFPVLRPVTLPPPSQPEGSRSLRKFPRRSQGLSCAGLLTYRVSGTAPWYANRLYGHPDQAEADVWPWPSLSSCRGS